MQPDANRGYLPREGLPARRRIDRYCLWLSPSCDVLLESEVGLRPRPKPDNNFTKRNCRSRPDLRHPDTEADLSQIQVPNWSSLLRLAARSYEATRLGYLGCDIVIDRNQGPLLLELNARPGLSIQIANNEGLLPRLRKIESLDSPFMSVQERVDESIRWFSRATESSQEDLWQGTEGQPAAG